MTPIQLNMFSNSGLHTVVRDVKEALNQAVKASGKSRDQVLVQGVKGETGANGTNGADGQSPALTWVGDQIAVNGVIAGPHLTGPSGGGSGDMSNLKAFAVAMAVAMG